MPAPSKALTIGNIKVKMIDTGLYCLNDLHKAAGDKRRHRPNEWVRIPQTAELIEEIKLITGETVIKKSAGRYGGTYVCRELVYAYAMWISPKFMLKVIRAFDALVQGNLYDAVAIARNAPTMEELAKEVEAIKADDSLTHGQKYDKILSLREKYEEISSDCGKGLSKGKSVNKALTDYAIDHLNKTQLSFNFVFA